MSQGITEIFAEGIRQMLVTVADLGARMRANGEAFPAGFQTAIDEVSIRLLGEDFDTYEDRVRAALKEIAINMLAKEMEQAVASESRGDGV